MLLSYSSTSDFPAGAAKVYFAYTNYCQTDKLRLKWTLRGTVILLAV